MRELLLYLFLFFALILNAQITPVEHPNLVVNGDFEEYNFCPDGPEGIYWEACVGWNSPVQTTPDYYHPCNYDFPWGGLAGVPSSFLGYQMPKSGLAYSGFYVWATLNYVEENNLWIECIQGELLNHLEKDKIYEASFYIAMGNYSAYAVKSFGISFSENRRWKSGQSGFNFIPDINFNSNIFFSDTLNWIKLSAYYIAKGHEKYLIIGSFQNIELYPDTIHTGIKPLPFEDGSYYYIDDVSIRYTGLEIVAPNVFTPNGDGINDYINFAIYGEGILSNIKVYNRWGKLVFEGYNNNAFWDGTYNNRDCPEGTYYYIITLETSSGEKIKAKSSLFLLR